MELLKGLTATDEAGNRYTLHFRGGASGGSGGAEMGTDLPVLWLRDDGGRWHTTRPFGAGTRDGEVTMRLLIVPPLHRSAWIEVVVAGVSAEARATLVLRWSLAAKGAAT
jgi:hypothetical protein